MCGCVCVHVARKGQRWTYVHTHANTHAHTRIHTRTRIRIRTNAHTHAKHTYTHSTHARAYTRNSVQVSCSVLHPRARSSLTPLRTLPAAGPVSGYLRIPQCARAGGDFSHTQTCSCTQIGLFTEYGQLVIMGKLVAR